LIYGRNIATLINIDKILSANSYQKVSDDNIEYQIVVIYTNEKQLIIYKS